LVQPSDTVLCLDPAAPRAYRVHASAPIPSRALSAAASPLCAQTRGRTVDEDDPANIKLCHRLNARSLTEDDLRFLQQIGLKWVRLEFDAGPVRLDNLRAWQQRFDRFGMRITRASTTPTAR
jgi:hypothetical protein